MQSSSLPGAGSLRIFIRLLSDCCRLLHLGPDEYYFFIASKSGADRRVMGIATAFETAPEMERFFVCTERFITSVSR